jgi:cell division initiation protein
MIEAKRKSEETIAEANMRAEAIINDAQATADEELNSIRADIDAEEENLANIQKTVSDFKKQLFDMYQNHLRLISAMPSIEDDEEDATSQEDTSTFTEETSTNNI